MVDWQITAVTIYCDAVDDEVTIMVQKKDWSVKCTGYQQYSASGNAVANPENKSKKLKSQMKCEGLGCKRVVGYKEKLIAEEASEAG